MVLAQYILNTIPKVPEAAVAALRKEVLNQLSLSIRYIAARYGLGPRPKAPSAGQYGKGSKPGNALTYANLGRLHAEIFSFYARVQAYELDEQEAVQLDTVIRSSRGIMNPAWNFYPIEEKALFGSVSWQFKSA
jgi:phosphate:Na+ symporter